MSSVRLNAMRAFEATARLGGYRAAAEEIGVTPEAVGQLVRGLEAQFGAPLLRRQARALRPTPEAAAVLPALTEAFATIAEAAARLRAPRPGGALTVSASPSVTAKWLAPRLGAFLRAHPGLDVRLDVTDRLADVAGGAADVALRYRPAGATPDPRLSTVVLFADERLVPVASPALLAARPGLARLDGLRAATLIADATVSDPRYPGWPAFMRARGLGRQRAGRTLTLGASVAVIEAAVRGEGVALAREVLAREELAEGRLVRLCDDPGLPTGWDYVAVTVGRPTKRAAAFVAWLTEAAAG